MAGWLRAGATFLGINSDPCNYHKIAEVNGPNPIVYVPLSDMRDCLEEITMTRRAELWTLHNLYYGIAETYSFTDIVTDVSASQHTNKCRHPVHELDVKAELFAMRKKYNETLDGLAPQQRLGYLANPIKAYEFHSRMVALFNSLNDAHTYYASPFVNFTVLFPLTFGSRMQGDQQVVTLRYSEVDTSILGSRAHVYKSLFHELPVPAQYADQIITRINGMEPIEFLQMLVYPLGRYQQLEQRLNGFVFSAPTLEFHLDRQNLPQFDSLDLEFTDGKKFHVKLIGMVNGVTSTYRTALELGEVLHENDRFDMFIKEEKAATGTIVRGSFPCVRVESMYRKQQSCGESPFRNPSTPMREVPEVEHTEIMQGTKESNGRGVWPGFTRKSGLDWRIIGDTIVVKLRTFDIEADVLSDGMREVQRTAEMEGTTRVLFEVSGNGGGKVKSAIALLWHLMPTEDICQTYRVRLTRNWDQWLRSFGGGIQHIVQKYFTKKYETLTPGKIDKFFDKIVKFVNLLYGGFGFTEDDFQGTKQTQVITRINRKRDEIKDNAQTPQNQKAERLAEFIRSLEFIPANIRPYVVPGSGFHPFDSRELRALGGGHPFADAETKEWGANSSKYSRLAEYRFCREILNKMSTKHINFDRRFWKEIGFVSDGTCGSACALFTTTLETSGYGIGFTFGGIANTALDISSFAGGNVEDYEKFWPKIAIAAKLGELASGGEAPFTKDHAGSWSYHPIAFPTKAKAAFNWKMMFMKSFGQEALPRQFYLVPGRKHFNYWGTDWDSMAPLLNEIIAIPKWRRLEHQFASTHGQCAAEIGASTKRA